MVLNTTELYDEPDAIVKVICEQALIAVDLLIRFFSKFV